MTDCIHDLEEGTCAICSGRERSRRSSGSGGTASAHFDVGSVELEAPYNADFVEDLKAAIPVYARSWDGDRRVWVISAQWWEIAAEIAGQYFDLAE